MQVGETIENYLETILILSKKNDSVRSIDVANEMGYSKPTISIMMKQLRESGLINIDDLGYITLTGSGMKISKSIYERHVLLTEILISLGVKEEIAREDACKIEHNLSKDSFDCIKEYYLKVKGGQ
jgi:Mn-dependent DtxR family transcriptional regulator